MPDNDKTQAFIFRTRKAKQRRIAQTAVLTILFTLLAALGIAAGLIFVHNRGFADFWRFGNGETPVTPSPDTDGGPDTSYGLPKPLDTDAAGAPSETDGGRQTEPEITGSDPPAMPDDYDYTKYVPQSEPVDISFFDDALFIGDSRTEGFMMYAGLNNAAYYSAKGLTASTAFTDRFVTSEGADAQADEKLTVAEAIELGQGFAKIYIMLGINELGWKNIDAFIDRYSELVRLVRKHNPGSYIYIQLIIPVSKSKSDSDEIYNNIRIGLFNSKIAQMCADESVFCINTPEAVSDLNGALPEDAGVDGVHMKRLYNELWRDYLFMHTAANIN